MTNHPNRSKRAAEYCVIPAEGHYGDRAMVVSTHRTLAAAECAATGNWQVVRCFGERKGDEIYRSDVAARREEIRYV